MTFRTSVLSYPHTLHCEFSMFKMEIATKNAAFDNMATELARILRDVAKKIERGEEPGTVRDSNGNTVGVWTITAEG